MASSLSTCPSRIFTMTFSSIDHPVTRRNDDFHPRSPRQKPNYARHFLALLALLTFASSAPSQTAHFGGTIRTLGSGFGLPWGVAVDGSGNIFIADNSNNAVYEIIAVGGVIPASPTINVLAQANGHFNGPQGLALDANGNLFVADTHNNSVKEVMAAGGYTTVNTEPAASMVPRGWR